MAEVKPRTTKRATLDDAARPWREAQVRIVGACERCGSCVGLCVHEIARGIADRKKAQDKGYATLVLCDPGCHQIVGEWTRAAQLALLYLRRPGEYDLEAYYRIVARRWPSQEDVDACVLELTNPRS